MRARFTLPLLVALVCCFSTTGCQTVIDVLLETPKCRRCGDRHSGECKVTVIIIDKR